jgi:predicted transcriptional regulator
MESELTDLSSLKADRFKANAHVLARFATAFAEKTSMKKTQLHFVSRISWKSFDNYLKWMEKNEYVELKLIEKEQSYRLTESGLKMFKTVLQLHEQMETGKTKN